MKGNNLFTITLIIISLISILSAFSGNKINIIYTNNVDGYLKACNCPGNLFGGLIYIDEVLNNIIKENPATLFIDGGDLFPAKNWKPKARYTIELYNKYNLTALNIGDQEFWFGRDYLKELEEKAQFPFISANILYNGKNLFDPYIIHTVNKIKIGIIGIVSPNAFSALDKEKINGIKVANIDSILPSILDELNKKVDLIVLLSHSGIETDKKIAQKFSEIDIIFGAHSESILQKPLIINNIPIIQVGSYAHYLGKIEIISKSNNTFNYNFELIKLEGVPVSSTAQSIYRDYLDSSDEFLASLSQSDSLNKTNLTTAPSAEDCGFCHFDQYNQWVRTPHAHAWQTIKEDGRTNDISCISCHTTLFEHENGFKNVTQTPHLINVTCVSCHTDFKEHSEDDPEMEQVKAQTCTACHDKANSPTFSYADYKKAIMHNMNYYTIKSGDWLTKIADRYYKDIKNWKDIFEANGVLIKNPNRIFPGQKIIIPVIPINRSKGR